MSSWNDPWDKPLWQRNAEDNMSLRSEIEKNYDAANNPLQTTTDFNMGNEDSFGENLSGLSNMGENDNFLLPQTDDFSRIWSQTLPTKHNQKNDLKDFSKPVQEQNSGFASYEQNSNPMAFASQEKNSDDDYLPYFERDKDELCQQEGGMIPYAYLDTAQKPNATIGCGINIEQTPNINLYHAQTKQPFNSEELSQEMSKLKKAHIPNKPHTFYEDKSNIRIAPEENDRIMKEKYKDAYAYVTSQYPDFKNYNKGQQKALMDMGYALGIPRFSKYKKMREAILNDDWEKAAEESWRYGSGIDRNVKAAVGLYPLIDKDKLKKRYRKW